MTQSEPSKTPRLTRVALAATALIAGGGFLYMVKLMHDIASHMGTMSGQMGAMATDMSQMRADMSSLARDVSDIAVQVRTLPVMGADMRRMREDMERMSGVVTRSGEQIEQMNPMGVLRQMVPGGGR